MWTLESRKAIWKRGVGKWDYLCCGDEESYVPSMTYTVFIRWRPLQHPYHNVRYLAPNKLGVHISLFSWGYLRVGRRCRKALRLQRIDKLWEFLILKQGLWRERYIDNEKPPRIWINEWCCKNVDFCLSQTCRTCACDILFRNWRQRGYKFTVPGVFHKKFIVPGVLFFAYSWSL